MHGRRDSMYEIRPERTGMLFFDTLNIYLHPDDDDRRAAIASSGIIGRLESIRAACRLAGVPVFFSQGDHRPDGRDIALTVVDRGYDDAAKGPRLSDPSPVRAGSVGAQVIPELAPEAADYVIKKHRWSAFFGTHLELSLRTAGIDTLMLAGGATEVGIASTAYSARDRDFNLIVISDACTSRRTDVHEVLIRRVFPIFARVLTVEEVLQELRATAPPDSAVETPEA
jgi:nicotinamidase-related amidase